MQFSLVKNGSFDTFGPAGAALRPLAEQVGKNDDEWAIWTGCPGLPTFDTDWGNSLGRRFIRYPQSESIGVGSEYGMPALLIEYTNQQTTRAAGSLYDIDGAGNGGTEQFVVRAFNANRQQLYEVTSPEGTQGSCVASGPTANNYDAWAWRFHIETTSGQTIKYIRIDFIGTKPFPYLAFDNFEAYGDCPGGMRLRNVMLVVEVRATAMAVMRL